jgi:hypothetical protein
MLMRFHFGLGVGHVYSHHRATQTEVQREGSAVLASFTQDVQDPEHGEVDKEEQGEQEQEQEQDDDDCDDCDDCDCDCDGARVGAIEHRFSTSNDSLEEFDDMYDSEAELDYEN